MQNSGGAKPKQKNTSHQKHQSEANNQNYNYGSQHSQNYCRTLSALSEPDEQKYKTDTNVRKKSITKQGKSYVKINNKTDRDQFAADLKKNRSERNYSSSPQQKVNNNLKVWERIQSPGLTDDIHSSHISNSNINSLSSVNLQKSQTDRILYCTAPRNEIIHQNFYQAYQNYRKITTDKVQMATDCFSYSKSNYMLCPSPFQGSRIRKYPECSHYERLKYLKSSFLKTFDQQMKMKEREIAQSINDDIKEIFKVHLSMLDRKKDTYNKQIENILNQQMQSNQINLIQKKFDRCNCALMEKRWLSAYRQDILQALTMSQVLIITGEMGYGKSTLLPLYAAEICSEMGTVVSCHPFHVTVITIANHLTKMLGTSLGKDVGYKLGKDQKVSSNTNIVFMTYHCLLKETVNNPFLSMYSCIILDDFENRSVEADIFLCKIKEILQQRPNFKLILIGSHPDERFEKFFDTGEKVTVISLPKITFPVNTFWNNLRNPSLYIEKAVELIKSINLQKKSGNVIVFLSTMQETQKACALVEEKLQNEVLCFSFHSKTNYDEIVKLYSSNPKRKIIFSTECAESSINLPNICFVIDSGKVKENIYNAEKQQSTISSSFISKERAERRKQLAGQIQNGCCYRLYTESIYLTEMMEKSLPSISKMNPANIVLTLLYYKIPVPSNANFICPLEKEELQAGSLVLKNIGAVKDSTLTKLGKTMALMTFELKHAKLVALGIEKGFSFETIIIALLSSLNTPIFNTVGKSKDIGKHRFFNPDGDYFAIFNVYLNWKKKNFAEDWCKANGINHSSLTSLHKKVTEMMAVLNVKIPHPQNIKSHKKLIELICDCFHDNLCVYSGHFILGYKSLNTGNFLRIHSSSTFSYKCDNPPQYIVYDYAIEHGNIDFVINVTPVPDDIIKTMLKNPEMVKESNQGCAMNSVVIEPVGEMFIKRELLGKQGKKLKILEDEIKRNINCDSVVIDPNADNGKIEIYTYSEYLNSAKETLLKHLRAYLEKLKNQEEAAHIPTGNVLMKVSWGQGGIITKISGTVNKYTLQEKVANEEESFCSVMHNYSINLTWIRRLCKGMGFVTFSCESDFDRAYSSLLSSELKIHEKEVRVAISKKAPNQIFIEDLLPQTSNEDLKEAVENSIHFSVASATIVCSPPFTTSQDDIELMKNILLLQYLGYVQDGNLSIHIETPNSVDTNMKAYLNVDNITDLTLLLNAIERDGLKTFQDIPIKYKPVYRTTIVCVPEHYNSVKTNIEKSLEIEKKEIFQNLKSINKFKFSTHFVNGKTQLKLLTNDYNVMQKTEKIIMDILRGEKLRNFNINQLRKLFSHSGQQWLKQAEKATKCYILKNSEQKTLSVCGTRESCGDIVRKIDNYLNNMENEIVSVINIGEKGFSRQVIKTLLLKYGVTLNKFIIECNLISVEFNVQYGQLTLYGTSSSIIKAEKELEILANQSRNLPSVDENEEICPVCLTVPTCGSSHRLEYCGHLYCTDCLKLLVVEKLLPLKCCKENCQEELVIEDILDTLEGNEKETEKLLHHSLNVYVEKNCKHVKYCPTPDCNMIYDLRSLASLQNSDLWTCPACMKVVCTRCNIKEHPGISCDIAKNMKNDDDYSLKIWMTKELNLRKFCPNCKSPIEKSGGCNHMTCQKCEKHFCWLCLQIFRDGNLVYNHLPYCSKNQRPYI